MRPLFRIAIVVLLAACAATPAWALEWQNWNNGLQRARATSRPVLVDVYTDWCGWCKRMDKDVYARADVSQYLAAHFVTVRLNAESGEPTLYQGHSRPASALASGFDVTGYPTTIFLTSGGEHLVNVPGYVEPDRFLLLLRYIGDGHLARGEKWEDYVKTAKPTAGGH
jgi:thioredoxin-related protein